jgi:hypothetical protein
MGYQIRQDISNQQIRDIRAIKASVLGSNVKNKDLAPFPAHPANHFQSPAGEYLKY